MKKYLITKREIEAALAEDRMTLEDYDRTIFGLVSDGEQWTLLEDSLDDDEALEFAKRAESYGEIVGLYVWAGV